MSFNKLLAFTKKVADFADKPAGTPAEKKAQFDAAADELRQYFNNLVDALKLTTAGDSGAKNIGATAISGLTGTDAQTLLESLKTYVDNSKSIGGWIGMTGYSGWRNYTGGGDYNTLQYTKIGNQTFIHGYVENGGNNTKITDIPVGFRPLHTLSFTQVTAGGFARVDVFANGDITLNGNYSTFLSLDGIHFPAEQ